MVQQDLTSYNQNGNHNTTESTAPPKITQPEDFSDENTNSEVDMEAMLKISLRF